MKKFLIGVCLIVVLLLAAVLIGPSFIDWNSYKGEIVEAARKATGRALSIDGDLSLRLLPAPALSAEGIRLANVEGGSEPDMARLAELDVRLALAPLLSGNIQVKRVRLIEPVLLLETTADGTNNWSFAAEEGAEARPSAGPSETGGGQLDLRFDEVELVDARIVYRDARSGAEEAITGLSATASAGSIRGPFNAKGSISARGIPLSFDLAVGVLETGQPLPVRLALKLEGTPGDAVVTATLSGLDAEPRVNGEVKLSTERVGAIATLLAPGASLPGLADQGLALSAKVAGTATQVGINDIELSLGDMQASGAVNLDLTEGLGFDAALEVGRINLDRLLAEAGGAGAKEEPSAPKAEASADQSPLALPALPAGLRGSVNLGIDGITYRGRAIRQVLLNVALADGSATLHQASALLPGGSDVRLSGTVANEAQEPVFKGRVDAASTNLRGLLDWLAIDVTGVPSGRLANVDLTANVDARPSLVQVADLNLRLDNSTITGGLAARVQRRPSFGTSISIDSLNLDGYLPRQPAAGDSAQQPGAKAGAPVGDGKPLAVLDGFDTNFALQIGQLTYNRLDLRDISVELTLFGGTMTLKQVRVGNVAGLSASASGAATGFSATPAIDLRAEMRAANLAALAKSLELGDGLNWQQVDGFAATVVANGTAESVELHANVKAAGAAVKATGKVADVLGTPALDVRVNASHADLAALLGRLGLATGDGIRGGQAVKFDVAAKGPLSTLMLDGTAEFAGLAARASGSLTTGEDQPAFDMKLDASHDDLPALVRSLGVEFRPALEPFGGLAIATAVKGTPAKMNFDGLSVNAGPARLEGAASLALDGARPYVMANLQASEIIVDLFLPRQESTAPRQGASQQRSRSQLNDQRWSREPIDLTGMGAVDADVQLAAAGLVFQDYPFVKPKLTLKLVDGALTVKELTGQLFGGNVGLAAVLESRPVTSFALNAKLVGADIEQALKTAVGLDTVTGRLDFDGSFRSRGNSEWDLVNGLNGNAQVHAERGVIRGFDLRRFSDRMQKLTDAAHFVDLVNRTFSGGETKYSTVDGTWQVENGVARTGDTLAKLDAAEATLTGQVSLPPWQMDLKSRMRLTEHNDAPTFGVDLLGPIDAPRNDVKTAELERWLLGRTARELLPKALGKKGGDIGKVLEGVLGGGQSSGGQSGGGQSGGGQSGGSGQTNQQPAPANPVDNLLRGLLKQ